MTNKLECFGLYKRLINKAVGKLTTAFFARVSPYVGSRLLFTSNLGKCSCLAQKAHRCYYRFFASVLIRVAISGFCRSFSSIWASALSAACSCFSVFLPE